MRECNSTSESWNKRRCCGLAYPAVIPGRNQGQARQSRPATRRAVGRCRFRGPRPQSGKWRTDAYRVCRQVKSWRYRGFVCAGRRDIFALAGPREGWGRVHAGHGRRASASTSSLAQVRHSVVAALFASCPVRVGAFALGPGSGREGNISRIKRGKRRGLCCDCQFRLCVGEMAR